MGERPEGAQAKEAERVAFTGPWPELGEAPMQGRHVLLERLNAGRHAAALHAGFAPDPATWDFMGYGPFAGAEDYAAWVASVEEGADPLFYAILGQDGQAAGLGCFLRIDRRHGVCEVGHVALTPALRRTPAATEALHLLAARAFDLGYRRFEWKCDACNQASRRAALRLGFTFEGIFRQHMVVKGRNRDTAWFAIIDRDWPRIAAAHRRWLDPDNFDAGGRQRRALSALTQGG